jgi:hypothetical protein
VVPELGMVAVAENRNGLAEGCPDIVEVDARGHDANDYFECSWFRGLDLLEPEGILGFPLSLLTDHPGCHLLGQFTGLDIKLAHISEIYWHFAPLGFFKVEGILHSEKV